MRDLAATQVVEWETCGGQHHAPVLTDSMGKTAAFGSRSTERRTIPGTHNEPSSGPSKRNEARPAGDPNYQYHHHNLAAQGTGASGGDPAQKAKVHDSSVPHHTQLSAPQNSELELQPTPEATTRAEIQQQPPPCPTPIGRHHPTPGLRPWNLPTLTVPPIL